MREERAVSELPEAVETPQGVKGFSVLYRRWVVERTLAWLGRCRHLAKDFERTIRRSVAWSKPAAAPGCGGQRDHAALPNNNDSTESEY